MSKTNPSTMPRTFWDTTSIDQYQDQSGVLAVSVGSSSGKSTLSEGLDQRESALEQKESWDRTWTGTHAAQEEGKTWPASQRKTANVCGENAVMIDALEKLQQQVMTPTPSRRSLTKENPDVTLSRMLGATHWRHIQRSGTALADTMKHVSTAPDIPASSQNQLQQAQAEFQKLAEAKRPSMSQLTSAVNHLVSVVQQSASVANLQGVDSSKLTEPGGKTEGTEQQGKSIWEKIADFFKQAFSWLLKIFEFLSPLLNLIPGAGPALFAAYQGIKLLAGIIQQDTKGVMGSIASLVGGLAGPGGSIATSVATMITKAAS